MRIVNEIMKTFVSGITIIMVTVAIVVAVFAFGGVLLYAPVWLIGEGHYLVGAVYTIFVWGVVWRLTE